MNIEYFIAFEKAKNLGLKEEATININRFIHSFTCIEEQKEWVKSYLEAGNFGHKIRHELYEKIIFPILLQGYEKNDPWAYYWLAETEQNINNSNRFLENIDYLSSLGLLKKCFALDSTNHTARLSLLKSIINSFHFAIHEWPAGILYAPNESADDFLVELDYARSLDTENQYADFFMEVEEIINEDKARCQNLH